MKVTLATVKEILKYEVEYNKHIYTIRYEEDGAEDITVLCFDNEVPIVVGGKILNWVKVFRD